MYSNLKRTETPHPHPTPPDRTRLNDALRFEISKLLSSGMWRRVIKFEKEPASSSRANLTNLMKMEVRFEVLVTESIKTVILVDVAPCKLVDEY
jgi:hypothetical protein